MKIPRHAARQVVTSTSSRPQNGAHQLDDLVQVGVHQSGPLARARVIGGPGVMRGQLAKLLDAVERLYVEVRVLPLSRGTHAGLDGSFWLYEMPDPYSDVAYVDTLGGARYVEDDAAVDRFPAAVGREELAAVGWHISSRSHDNGGSCVEAGPLRDGSGRVAVRHSRHPDDAVIVYTRDPVSLLDCHLAEGFG